MMKLLSILAIGSIAAGPILPGGNESASTLTMSLCNGGEITIPLGDGEGGDPRDCQSNACHATTCREKNKRFPKPDLI